MPNVNWSANFAQGKLIATKTNFLDIMPHTSDVLLEDLQRFSCEAPMGRLRRRTTIPERFVPLKAGHTPVER